MTKKWCDVLYAIYAKIMTELAKIIGKQKDQEETYIFL